MGDWQPIEVCPENTWVLLHAEWEDTKCKIGKFRWERRARWSIESISVAASGARREIRQEKISAHRVWDDGCVDGYTLWHPLPELPQPGDRNERP